MLQELAKTETEIVIKMSKSDLENFLREVEKLDLDEEEIEISWGYIH